MDVSEHPLDKPIQRFADALETWLGKWGRRITQVLWKEYQNRPRGFRALFSQKQADLLTDEELWQEVIDSGYGIAFPYVNEAAYAGYAAGEEMLLNIGAVVDFDLVNPAIVRIGIWDTMELVSGVGNTTRAQLREMMRTFYEAPDVAKNDFIAALEPLFGRTRAEMIAVTEMTNAYSAATIETARHAPIDVMYDVSTVRDPLVCTICTEAEAGGPYPLSDEEHRPALHPRCRCDAVIVERPAEMPEKRPYEQVTLLHATEAEEAYWNGYVGRLPDDHLIGLDRVEYVKASDWATHEAGIGLRHPRAAGVHNLGLDRIWYKRPYGRDSHIVIHEVGHHVHLRRHPEWSDRIADMFAKASKWDTANPGVWEAVFESEGTANHFISRYSLNSANEFFAEHYAAYVNKPWALKRTDPKIYNWFRDTVFEGLEF